MKSQILLSAVVIGGIAVPVSGFAQEQPLEPVCPVLAAENLNCAFPEDPLPPPALPPPATSQLNCSNVAGDPDPIPGASCPFALPAPAQDWMVECKASENTRCGGGLPTSECNVNNDRALANGLLTDSAYCWLKSNGWCAINVDTVHTILAICPVGCFEENSEILTLNKDGAGEWLAAKMIGMEHQLFSLTADSLLSSPQLSNRSIERMSVGPEEPPLYVFALSNGRKLRVTSQHAMVLADGRIVIAEKVVEGDLFIGVDGNEVAIESITREVTTADVYNFWVAADTPQEHVIAAEGVLVGDLAWQSTLVSEMESIELRR